MQSRSIVLGAIVLAVAAMAACKDKDAVAGERGGGAAVKGAAAARVQPKASAKDERARLAEIKAIDCEAACRSQNACFKKFGLPAADKPETMKMCMDGCAQLVSDGGSVEVKLSVGAKMLEYAAGRCP